MNIKSNSSITQIFARVTDKSNDKQGGAGQNAYERQQKKDQKEEEFEATIEEVSAAIEKFAGDEATLTAGITAQSEGTGPGLRVLLKDPSGGVLRSVSGEEFLKLREAVNAGNKSGRLLDQKA
jgi:hypothetical protein